MWLELSGSSSGVFEALVDLIVKEQLINACDIHGWLFKEESNRGETKNRVWNKKPAQLKDDMQDFKVQESTTEGKCVAGPCLMKAQAKNTDKIHSLKVKEAMSSVDKSTIEDLQKKDSTLKKCFARVGKPIIRENYVGEFFMKNGLLYQKYQETKTGRSQWFLRGLTTGYVCELRISI